jgi:PIN domain nuclease of toxin-antitoxin system
VILLDTHAWLWLADDPARLSPAARAAAKAADRIGVCTISCWEVGMLVQAGRIRIDRDPRHWMRQALAAERIETIPLTSEIALSAALLPSDFPGDPADRIIYSTANELGARLVTRDRSISSFDPQRTIW